MLEKDIEKRLKDRLKKRVPKAVCLKFVSPGFSGVPDRIILLPHGVVIFAELKRPGKVERQRQRFVQALLRRLGFMVFSAVNSFEKVEQVVARCEMLAGEKEVAVDEV